MDIVLVLLPLSLILAACFAWLFVRAVRSGQFEDPEDAARRILDDDDDQGVEEVHRSSAGRRG
jgi:cbb3-type cytochrome oxidase maturation protein